jgi:DNA invertase Pin-like site-specific DNA recombinase
MKIGYARVSSEDQNLDTQIERLKAEGCEKLYTEKLSGASDINERVELQAALSFAREGDTLVFLRLDRLTRGGMLETLTLLKSLDDRKITYKFLDSPGIDTTTSAGRIMTVVTAEFANAYLVELKQKQAAGIELAKARGVYKGGTKRYDDNAIRAMKASGKTPAAIRKELGCSKATVKRALRANGLSP